jgi:2-iminobutanoate/2-iminopropanoate deaminase
MVNPKFPFSPFISRGNLIFTSGQVYLTPEGGLLERNIKEQTHQVMKNLQGVLEKAGVTFKDVVKTTIYLTDMSLYAEVNEIYASYFEEPYPARETVCVKELPLGARLEISMVASK